MIEIPLEYLLLLLTGIATLFIILWTALGVYFLALKEIVAGIVVLCSSAIFWVIILSMLEIVVWV